MTKMSDDNLKKKLTSEEYHITQEKGTEAAFSGKYWDNHETGMYQCVVCEHPLFSSETKFDSGTGWPSFNRPVNCENIELRQDKSFFMKRTEVICKNCGAHLGHLFDDGPRDLPAGRQATGQRFCINSCALNFKAKEI